MDASYAPARLALGMLYARSARLTEAAGEFERCIALDRIWRKRTTNSVVLIVASSVRRKRKPLSRRSSGLAIHKGAGVEDRKEIVDRLASVLFDEYIQPKG